MTQCIKECNADAKSRCFGQIQNLSDFDFIDITDAVPAP